MPLGQLKEIMRLKCICVIASLFLTGLLYAQEPVSIECRTGKGLGTKLQLFRVERGNKVVMATAGYNENGYYGFKFIPEYEGFYVIGDDRRQEYPLYLKAGDAVSLYMDRDTAYLTGKKNTPENKILYDWVGLSGRVKATAFRLARTSWTFRQFFPELEAFLLAADRFEAGVKTKNARFDALMKRSIAYEKDLYALAFLYTPRSEHPKKEDRPVYYTTIINPDKFKDDVVLQMPYGMDFLTKYITFVSLENQIPNEVDQTIALIPNENLKGELVVRKAGGIKSYFEYTEFMAKVPGFLAPGQKKRLEAVGTKLYEARKGQPAADITYPDASGKQVSLTDFKGKVIVVDVWATWCGPCRGELPHLKKLEEEMKGTDVVFVGISVDEQKNYEKWKKCIVDEQLPGIQLFAGGWSKITKDYKITGIPRFMVFDREGKVVEAMAPRPSNPSLKALLEEELKRK